MVLIFDGRWADEFVRVWEDLVDDSYENSASIFETRFRKRLQQITSQEHLAGLIDSDAVLLAEFRLTTCQCRN